MLFHFYYLPIVNVILRFPVQKPFKAFEVFLSSDSVYFVRKEWSDKIIVTCEQALEKKNTNSFLKQKNVEKIIYGKNNCSDKSFSHDRSSGFPQK